jgi:hypothetical protein
MPLIHRGGKWRPVGQQSHGTLKIGVFVLAMVPVCPGEVEQERVKITAFHKRDDGRQRVEVEDDDGVRCWINADMICRQV